jgi:hypothetical protein
MNTEPQSVNLSDGTMRGLQLPLFAVCWAIVKKGDDELLVVARTKMKRDLTAMKAVHEARTEYPGVNWMLCSGAFTGGPPAGAGSPYWYAGIRQKPDGTVELVPIPGDTTSESYGRISDGGGPPPTGVGVSPLAEVLKVEQPVAAPTGPLNVGAND